MRVKRHEDEHGWLEDTAEFVKNLKPWFVSEVNSLYAMALFDSPLAFRNNNIFVLENFLNRA
jgi:hypothetical protein